MTWTLPSTNAELPWTSVPVPVTLTLSGGARNGERRVNATKV